MNKKREQYFLYINGEAVPVTREVYDAFWHYTNKEDYFMRQLKKARRIRDRVTQEWIPVPARECSLEQFLEYPGNTLLASEEFESLALSGFWLEFLLETLTEEEREIVHHFYIQGKSEREACAAMGLPKTTFRRREKRLREKLGILLKNFL